MSAAPESGHVAPGTPATAPSVVTVHVWRVPTRKVPAALTRMATDRVRLRSAAGVQFARLLGTGQGTTFAIRDADLQRWALLASWDTEADAAAFERSTIVRGW